MLGEHRITPSHMYVLEVSSGCEYYFLGYWTWYFTLTCCLPGLGGSDILMGLPLWHLRAAALNSYWIVLTAPTLYTRFHPEANLRRSSTVLARPTRQRELPKSMTSARGRRGKPGSDKLLPGLPADFVVTSTGAGNF